MIRNITGASRNRNNGLDGACRNSVSVDNFKTLLKHADTCMEEGYEAVYITAAPYRSRKIGFLYAVIGCDMENGTYAVWEGYDGKGTLIRKRPGFPTLEAAIKAIF